MFLLFDFSIVMKRLIKATSTASGMSTSPFKYFNCLLKIFLCKCIVIDLFNIFTKIKNIDKGSQTAKKDLGLVKKALYKSAPHISTYYEFY